MEPMSDRYASSVHRLAWHREIELLDVAFDGHPFGHRDLTEAIPGSRNVLAFHSYTAPGTGARTASNKKHRIFRGRSRK